MNLNSSNSNDSLLARGLFLSLIYVVLQLTLMAIVYLVFSINLFELDKNPSGDFMSRLPGAEMKLFVVLNQVIGMFLPALFYLLFFYKKDFYKRIDLRISEKYEVPLLGLALLIFSYPLIQFLAWINLQIDIPLWMESTSGEIEGHMAKMMNMESVSDLIINVLVVALIPALCEELLFRGVFQKEFIKFIKNDHIAIVITAAIFSAFHLQFDGFLPRFGLGLILGYAYYYSKSLFIPILMHFMNNAIMVYTLYLNPGKMDQEIEFSYSFINYLLIIFSAIIIVYLLFLIRNKEMDYGSE